MKISIVLLLIVSILSSTDYDEEYYHFYDITFNELYYVDMSKYTYGFLPAGHHYYFRLAVYPNDKLEIQCTVQKYAVTAFKVDVCPFYNKPSNNDVYHGNNLCVNALTGTRTDYEKYDRYTYPLSTGENVNYLAIHLENIYSLNYLDIYVYSESGRSDYDDQYYHFYDITFNERYYVDMTKYTQGFLPAGHNYYFRLAVYPNDKMEIQCTVQKYAYIAFKVDVCPFYDKPSNNDVYHGNSLCANSLTGTRTDYENYDRYTYPFSTGENVNYLAVHLQNMYSLNYLDVYVYSESGWGVSLILLVIFLPCIIIAAVVLVVLKYCCGCNISIRGGGGKANMI